MSNNIGIKYLCLTYFLLLLSSPVLSAVAVAILYLLSVLPVIL